MFQISLLILQLKGLLSDMSGIYGNGKVCLSDDVCLKLEPGKLHL